MQTKSIFVRVRSQGFCFIGRKLSITWIYKMIQTSDRQEADNLIYLPNGFGS